MVDDLSDSSANIRALEARVRQLEAGIPFESASLTNGRFRVIAGEFRVDEDGTFTLIGTFDQEGTYNILNGGVLTVQGGGAVRVQDGGDVEVQDGGVVTVESGGEVRVNGPVPVRLRQGSVGGVSQAMIQFEDASTAIYANQAGGNVNLVIQSGAGIIQVTDDGVSFPGLRTGGASHYLGVDGDGYVVRASNAGGGDPDPGDPPSGNPDGYIWPADPDRWGISDDYAAHVARGSAEPGVDVMTPVGTPLWSPAAGTIVDVQSSPAGATGRYVTLVTTEGDWFRFLHNSSVVVSAGDTVEQAQLLAYTGGSGFGQEAYYGPHSHISFAIGYTGTFPGAGGLNDFEAYMADQ